MKAWVARHPLAAYFVLAYGLSWGVAVPLALQAQGVLHTSAPLALHYLTAFGPAAAALLVAYMQQETASRPGGRRRPTVGRPLIWWTIGFASPLLFFEIARTAARIAGAAAPAWTSLGDVSFLPALGLAAWPFWFLTSGCGEEFGWRGFALPLLQRTHSALVATLLLTIAWAGWHLPTFFYIPTYRAMGIVVIPGFFLGLLAGAILLTWLFNNSGSVISAALWHASFNFVAASPSAGGPTAAVTSSLVMMWAAVVVWKCDWRFGLIRDHAAQSKLKSPDPAP